MKESLVRQLIFPFGVAVAVTLAMLFPQAFTQLGGFQLKLLIVPLIQVIMFGMGTTMSLRDFTGVLRMPHAVLIGIALQFMIMPCLGWGISKLFAFEPEIAAGVILVGSVSGGVASNVITYLARGNVPLSVTMTACSTLLAPVMTPFLMKTLAGKLIAIDFLAMMISILDMTIVPIAAGLLANQVIAGARPWSRSIAKLMPIGAALLAAGATLVLVPEWFPFLKGIRVGLGIGMLLVGLTVVLRLIALMLSTDSRSWMERALPIVSMSAICFIIAIITSGSREQLKVVGIALVGAAILHNLCGYGLGYWLARLARLPENDCRTVAIEVGMQNGGMATGLAVQTLKSMNAALAPAIFGPWMNISGALLAAWWKRKPVS